MSFMGEKGLSDRVEGEWIALGGTLETWKDGVFSVLDEVRRDVLMNKLSPSDGAYQIGSHLRWLQKSIDRRLERLELLKEE
jgi:hypothetical protein